MRKLFKDSHPLLFSELHSDKNNDLNFSNLFENSAQKVWWQCRIDLRHQWYQTIRSRTIQGYGCPFCSGRRTLREESFAYLFPELASELHPTKNPEFDPYNYSPNSNKTVWWQCRKGHVSKDKIFNRIIKKSGCKICKQLKNSLAFKYPEIAKEWHQDKNNSLSPKEVSPGSNLKVWWQCKKNPNHAWQSTVYNRVSGKGCPFCAKTAVTHENSLSFRFPNIAKQWHPLKNNDLKPSDVSYGRSKKVWWRCQEINQHEWQSSVNSRTQKNNNQCPICTKSRYNESNSLEVNFPAIAAEWHPEKNLILTPNQVTKASGKKVWWQCPVNSEHEWEAEIKNRTLLGSGCPFCANEKNIIRLQEHIFDIVYKDLDYYHNFLNHLSTLKKLLNLKFSESPKIIQSFYRMIFSSIITALETYLSDAFHNKVINNDNLLEKFICSVSEFSNKQYALTEVIEWQKNIKKKVTEYLFNIIWHNLPKVENMYKSVLEVDFPEDISDLHKAVAIRHDIVHRNGRTKSGRIHSFDKNQI